MADTEAGSRFGCELPTSASPLCNEIFSACLLQTTGVFLSCVYNDPDVFALSKIRKLIFAISCLVLSGLVHRLSFVSPRCL